MSYILDALRRADAERERGAVPSLQSQQHTIADDDATPAARSRALVWAVVGLAVALVAAVAWNLFGSSHAPPVRPTAEGAVAPAAPPAAVVLPTTPVATPPASTTAPPPDAMAAPPHGAAPAAPHQAAPKIATEPRPARHRAEPKRSTSHSAEGHGATPAGEPNAAAAAGDARVYKQAELPEDIRRDLPKLAIGGASYSGDAASRMVMINGQVFHEGDRLAPQLVLERIKLKSAVLSYKGYRYEVTF
jgi:general secretion pathway protein B